MAIIRTAEPFYFPGNRIGCLLVHGFTGTPKEMRPLGEYLNAAGYTVMGIRLAGHATKPEDMMRVRYTDWLANLEDGWFMLREHVDHIYLLGLSMGGVLSLTFAGSGKHDLTGVVAMSTPFTLPDHSAKIRFLKKQPPWFRYWLIATISKLFPYDQKPAPEIPTNDLMASHISYPYNPTRAGAELSRMMIKMQQVLPQIRAPVLLIHSYGDRYVPVDFMEEIYIRLRTRDKKMHWLEKSGHVVTRDVEHKQVFGLVHEFIYRISPTSLD